MDIRRKRNRMKAILMIDMPKNCEECSCHFDDSDYGMYCVPKFRSLDYPYEKPSWCPLRPLPDKLISEMVLGNAFARGCCQGWNDCIDEITGCDKVANKL